MGYVFPPDIVVLLMSPPPQFICINCIFNGTVFNKLTNKLGKYTKCSFEENFSFMHK